MDYTENLQAARRVIDFMGGDLPAEEWARRLDISPSTVYRWRRENRIEEVRRDVLRTAVDAALKHLAYGDTDGARAVLRTAKQATENL